MSKPPIGVIPHRFWLEDRAKALTQAIERYVVAGYGANRVVIKWHTELAWVLEQLGN